ncbi:MAG: hypothetical protein ACKODX_04240 [Gemmata sp.]
MGIAANLIVLTVASLSAAGLGFVVVLLAGGSVAAVPVVLATTLCLAPAGITLVFAELASKRLPDFGPAAVMIGTAMRLGAAVIGVVVFGEAMEQFGTPRERFAQWVAYLYLVTLVVECGLLINRARQIRSGATP